MYDWESIQWNTRENGERYAHITLNAGEYISVEEGWDIIGPMRVALSYDPSDEYTHIEYKRLKSSEFDIDDPHEYPCVSCGAERGQACIGDKHECTYRVFFIGGGVL